MQMASWLFEQTLRRIRARQKIVVATEQFLTIAADDTEWLHVIVFCKDGNGRRFTDLHTTHDSLAEVNDELLEAETNWLYHEKLSAHATRVNDRERGQLVVLRGGGGGEAA